MSDKTAAQAFRELREAWLELVLAYLYLLARPLDWINQLLARDKEEEA